MRPRGARAGHSQPRRSGAACRSSYRRHPEEAVLRVGRVRERLFARQRGPRLVLGQHVDEVEGMGRRLDVLQVELGHLPDRLQDRRQLLAHLLDLVAGELEPRQPGYVENVVSRDCHLSILANETGPFRDPFGSLRKETQAAWTLAAWRPLSPWMTSNSTFCPSVSVL